MLRKRRCHPASASAAALQPAARRILIPSGAQCAPLHSWPPYLQLLHQHDARPSCARLAAAVGWRSPPGGLPPAAGPACKACVASGFRYGAFRAAEQLGEWNSARWELHGQHASLPAGHATCKSERMSLLCACWPPGTCGKSADFGPAAAGFEALLIEAVAGEAGYDLQVMMRLCSLPWAVKQLR